MPMGISRQWQRFILAANSRQFSRFDDMQHRNMAYILLEDRPGLLDNHLKERLRLLIAQHHRLSALAAARLAATQVLPISAKRRSAGATVGALLRTGSAIEPGRVAKEKILADQRFLADAAARQRIQAARTEPMLIED